MFLFEAIYNISRIEARKPLQKMACTIYQGLKNVLMENANKSQQ